MLAQKEVVFDTALPGKRLIMGVSSGSGLRHREEATQPHAQKRYGLSSLR